MDELEKLIGMDLPDEAKALLTTIKTSHTALTEANKTMVDTIASKENANAELIQARKDLKTELQEVKDSKLKTDDKSVQEKLDALNSEWNEKYQTLAGERDTIKTDMLNKTKFDEFNGLNIASLLPKEWSKEQIAVAMGSIENQVLGGATHDDTQGWVYKDNDVTRINPLTGKPMTISEQFESVKSSGSINMFLADSANSGSGTPPNSGNIQTVSKQMARSQFESLPADRQTAFMSDGGQLTD